MARPKHPILSVDGIRDGALAIIDKDGLPGLSMRRLADELGVQAASLYSHFPNKDAVLDAVANLLGEAIDATAFNESWQTGIRVWARSFHSVLRKHPNAATVVASGWRHRPHYVAISMQVHRGLVSHGWDNREARLFSTSVAYFVIGAATTQFSSGFADDTAVYLDRYANRSQAQRVNHIAERIDLESFELGLESLIEGFEPVRLGLVGYHSATQVG